MRAWTITEQYVEVITEEGKLVRADIWYHGTMKLVTIEGKDLVVARLR